MLVERIPDAELALVVGAGHAYALECPERSAAMVTRWLDRREPIPAGAPRTGVRARAEPVTRALGLPIGRPRTGASLPALGRRVKEGVAMWRLTDEQREPGASR